MADAPVAQTVTVPKKIVFDNYDSTIVKIDAPMENLYVFQFKLEGEKRINFTAGQYVSVIIPGAIPAPFSIASSPETHDMIELGIEITGGPVTSVLKKAKLGDHAVLRGPFGTFTIGAGEKKIAFLAGGVGVTPFMCMLRWIRDTKQDIQATLFYSCKVRQQFLWLDELERMAQECPNIRLVLTVTREDPPGWTHSKGRINDALIKEKLPDFAEHTFYSCGPPALIEAMFSTLRTMGIPEDRLKKEKW